MSQDEVKLSLDALDLIEELGRAKRAWRDYVKAESEVIGVNERFNTSGERVETTLRGITKEGERVTATMKMVEGAMTVTSKSLDVTAARTRKLREEQQKLNALNNANAAKAASREAAGIGKFFGRLAVPATSTVNETAKFKNEIGKIKDLALEQGVTLARVKQVWRDINNGQINAYSGKLRTIQNSLLALRASHDSLGSAAEKSHIKQVNSALAARDAQRRAVIKATDDLRKLDEQAAQAVKTSHDLALSWKSIGRIVGIQLAHQAISVLTRSMREAITASLDLEIAISQVQTIDNTRLAYDQWRESIRAVSDAFGTDIIDQTRAAYHTLSNQVADGAEAMMFLAEANKFAVAAVTTSEDAVNLLTATLNAFNIDLTKTDEVAASLFKTIEQGRILGSELANTFGRVAVPANQLGVTLHELEAALATATIRGIKTEEAMTLIRNVMLKLIRPTDEMRGFLADLGFESGEAAIRVLGFSGVLAAIEERAQGSSDELGELFGRIRAIVGAMIFAGRGLKDYENNLNEITNAQGSFNRAVTLTLENTGKQMRIELNKIKNAFLVDFADNAIRGLSRVTNNFEHFDTVIIKTAQLIISALVPAVAALTVSVIALNAASLANPWVLGSAAIAVVATMIANEMLFAKTAIDRFKDAYTSSMNKVREEITNTSNVHREAVDDMIDDFIRFQDASANPIERRQALFLGSMNKQSKEYKDTLDNMASFTKTAMDTIEESVKKTAKEATKSFDDLIKGIESGISRLSDLRIELSDKLFDLNLEDKSKTEQLEALLSRLAEMQAAAKSVVSGGGSQEDFEATSKRALALVDRIAKLTKDANDEDKKSTEERIKLQKELLSIKSDLFKEQAEIASKIRIATAENDRQEILNARKQLVDKELEAQEKIVKIQKEIDELKLNNVKLSVSGLLTDEYGSAIQQQERLIALSREQQKIEQEKAKTASDLADSYNLAKAALQSMTNKELLDIEDPVASKAAFEARIAAIDKMIELSVLSKAPNSTVDSLLDLRGTTSSLAKVQNNILVDHGLSKELNDSRRKMIANLEEAQKINKDLITEVGHSKEAMAKFTNLLVLPDDIVDPADVYRLNKENKDKLTKALFEYNRSVFDAVADQKVTSEELAQILKNRRNLPNIEQGNLRDGGRIAVNLADIVQDIDQMGNLFQDINTVFKDLQGLHELEAERKRQQEAIENLTSKIQAATEELDRLNKDQPVNRFNQSIENASQSLENFNRILKEINDFNTPQLTPPAQGVSFPSASRFQGNSQTSNTTIQISIDGSGDPKKTAEAVASTLRRWQNNGTFSVNTRRTASATI